MSDQKGFLDTPRSWITDPELAPGKKLSIRQLGQGVKEGIDNMVTVGKDAWNGASGDPLNQNQVEPSDPKNYGR